MEIQYNERTEKYEIYEDGKLERVYTEEQLKDFPWITHNRNMDVVKASPQQRFIH